MTNVNSGTSIQQAAVQPSMAKRLADNIKANFGHYFGLTTVGLSITWLAYTLLLQRVRVELFLDDKRVDTGNSLILFKSVLITLLGCIIGGLSVPATRFLISCLPRVLHRQSIEVIPETGDAPATGDDDIDIDTDDEYDEFEEDGKTRSLVSDALTKPNSMSTRASSRQSIVADVDDDLPSDFYDDSKYIDVPSAAGFMRRVPLAWAREQKRKEREEGIRSFLPDMPQLAKQKNERDAEVVNVEVDQDEYVNYSDDDSVMDGNDDGQDGY